MSGMPNCFAMSRAAHLSGLSVTMQEGMKLQFSGSFCQNSRILTALVPEPLIKMAVRALSWGGISKNFFIQVFVELDFRFYLQGSTLY